MNKTALHRTLLALAGTAAFLVSTPGYAAGDYYDEEDHEVDQHEAVRGMVLQGDILPLEQILDNARRHRAGRVLETELENRRGELVYEVEILDSKGVVWEMNFDARNGELIKEEQGF